MTSGPNEGRTLGGRYELGEVIGRGGMADVYAGYDTRLNRPVAIKLLRPELARDRGFLSRFRREAQSAARLTDPSIVAIYDTSEETTTDDNGTAVHQPYIVMERLKGQTLRERLSREGSLPPAEAAQITGQVLQALAVSHRSGIAHRDIKPANVMLTDTGDVKVMDFGIARAVADSAATMTQNQAIMGTAQYLSPEQAQGQQVDERTDLYSAGCLLFELLTGRAPFHGDTPVALAYQHVGEQPEPPSQLRDGIPAAYDAIVLHAMEKDRENRYQNAVDFQADLGRARDGQPVSEAARASLAGSGSTAAATQVLGPVSPAAPPQTGSAPPAPTTPITVAEEPGQPVNGPSRPAGPPAPRRSGWVTALLVLSALGVLALAVIFVRPLLSEPRPEQVEVPYVVGQTESEATDLIRSLKLFPQIDPVIDSEHAPDTVIDQFPNSGDLLDVGSTVRITVSRGPGTTTVPDVVGQPKDVAITSLQLRGLSESPIIEYSDDPAQPKDNVISIDPPAGATVDKTAKITLTVSSGQVEVPDLVGKYTDTAQRLAEDAALVYERGETIPTSDPAVLEGTVLEQDIAPGTKVDQDTTITVKIAVREASTATVSVTVTETPTSTSIPTTEAPTTTAPPTTEAP